MIKFKRLKINNTLPTLPSELLGVALKDLISCERSPRYKINMGEWHTPVVSIDSGARTCNVCLAGSVMARTLNIPYRNLMDPTDLANGGIYVESQLLALNSLRSGHVHLAIREVASNFDEVMAAHDIIRAHPFAGWVWPREWEFQGTVVRYKDNRLGFRKFIREMIAHLKTFEREFKYGPTEGHKVDPKKWEIVDDPSGWDKDGRSGW